MAGQLTTNVQDFDDSAKQWSRELKLIAIIGCDRTLKFMTPMANIREKVELGTYGITSQLRPYSSSMSSSDHNLNIIWRELETFQGAIADEFDPNSAIRTIIGKMAAHKGEGLKTAEATKMALSAIAKSCSEHLNMSIWSAVRNPQGSTTKDIFDGFDTITAKEITAGNIAASKGNYLKLSQAITSSNACDTFKAIARGLDPVLRETPCYCYLSQELYDLYVECYQSEHGALPYNTEYNKRTIEDSISNITFVPLASKVGSKFIHITPKDNLIYGYDNMSDAQNIAVEKHKPFLLTFVMSMFFGVQFQTIDKRVLKVIELADETRTVSLSCTAADGTVQIGSGSAGATATDTVALYGKVTIKAVAASGKLFVKWSDDDTNATREITITDNVTLSATFEADSEEE